MADVTAEPSPRVFLLHVHYFRAFAIINIAVLHTWWFPRPLQHGVAASIVWHTKELAFHDSTVYFLFISGFLFFHLSHGFSIAKYYKSKLSNVIAPYLFISSACLLFQYGHKIFRDGSVDVHVLRQFVVALLRGQAQVHFWYIPFVSMLFLISPVLLRIPKDLFRRIVFAVCLLPLLGTRTGTWISVQQYLYFMPVYLLGCLAALHQDAFAAVLRKWRWILIGLGVAATIVLAALHAREHRFGPFDFTESVFYIQKLSICFLVFGYLERRQDRHLPLLDLFARFSFAIYFVHLIVANEPLRAWFYTRVVHYSPALLLPSSIVFTMGCIAATLALCVAIKAALGRSSRFFIGA